MAHHPLKKNILCKSLYLGLTLFLLGAVIGLLWSRNQFFSGSSRTEYSTNENNDAVLKKILKKAAMPDNTVILTIINDAWSAPNSMLDVSLETMKKGIKTKLMLRHLIIVTLDTYAQERCLTLHPYCYHLASTEEDITIHMDSPYMSPNYVKISFKKLQFQIRVLDLGYSFFYTDSDIAWFREPFEGLYPDGDLQLSCDKSDENGACIEDSLNTGIMFAKVSSRTRKLFRYWNAARMNYPGERPQDILKRIRYDGYINDIGVQIKFLDTNQYSGFCHVRNNFKTVRSMHAICCIGHDHKIHDLRNAIKSWSRFHLDHKNVNEGNISNPWNAPQRCRFYESANTVNT